MIARKPIGTGFLLEKAEASEYGRRSGRARYIRYQITVEGELVTTADIGKRIGGSVKLAQKRLRLAQQQPGPVTWAGLGAKG